MCGDFENTERTKTECAYRYGCLDQTEYIEIKINVKYISFHIFAKCGKMVSKSLSSWEWLLYD